MITININFFCGFGMRNIVKKPIALVGMMGTGKSTIGKRLAYKLNFQFYDSDKLIEDREGFSIIDIFDFRGENYFKKREEEIIKEILGYGTVVLSTGGESFLNPVVREYIKEKAISIWLKSSPEVMYERVARRNTRPQLQVGDKKEVIEKMIEQSYPVLEEADIMVESKDMDAHFVVDSLMLRLQAFLESNG